MPEEFNDVTVARSLERTQDCAIAHLLLVLPTWRE